MEVAYGAQCAIGSRATVGNLACSICTLTAIAPAAPPAPHSRVGTGRPPRSYPRRPPHGCPRCCREGALGSPRVAWRESYPSGVSTRLRGPTRVAPWASLASLRVTPPDASRTCLHHLIDVPQSPLRGPPCYEPSVVEIAPHIMVDSAIRFGRPVIEGTRVPVDVVVGQVAAGRSVEQIADDYDLTREQVLAALTYAAKMVADETIRAVG
jgi:uncharacterized protein (DUF433 family)